MRSDKGGATAIFNLEEWAILQAAEIPTQPKTGLSGTPDFPTPEN